MRKVITPISLSIISAALLFVPFVASAAIVGGTSLETATLVGAGTHDLGVIEDMLSKYIKVNVKGGQQLEAVIESNGYDRYGEFRLYGPDKKEMYEKGYDPFPQTIIFAPGSLSDEGDGGEHFIEVKNRQGGEDGKKPVAVTIKLNDVSDAKSSKDAGDTFSNALEIQPGKYMGFLSARGQDYDYDYNHDKGTDKIDMYMIKLAKGEKLTVSVAPHEKTQLRLKVYDSSRIIAAKKNSKNSGAIIQNVFTSNEDQNVYFSVDYYAGEIYHFYDLNVKVEGREASATTGVGSEGTIEPGKYGHSGDATFTLEARAKSVIMFKVTPAAGQPMPVLNILNGNSQKPAQYAINYSNGSAEVLVKVTGLNTPIAGGKGTFNISVSNAGTETYTIEYKVKRKWCL